MDSQGKNKSLKLIKLLGTIVQDDIMTESLGLLENLEANNEIDKQYFTGVRW